MMTANVFGLGNFWLVSACAALTKSTGCFPSCQGADPCWKVRRSVLSWPWQKTALGHEQLLIGIFGPRFDWVTEERRTIFCVYRQTRFFFSEYHFGHVFKIQNLSLYREEGGCERRKQTGCG